MKTFFQIKFETTIICREIHIFTGSRKQLFNWLRSGNLEILSQGDKYKRVFEFFFNNNGVARVEFRHPIPIHGLKINLGKQDAWLMIEDIDLIVE